MGKSKVSSFFSNLWYYHKWHILFGAFILLVVAVTVAQCAGNTDPDVGIVYVGDFDIGNSNREAVQKDFADLYRDVNGDGEKNIDIAFMSQNDEKTRGRLQTEVVAGEHYIFFVDGDSFDWLLSHKVLAPLKAVLGEEPENSIEGHGIKLKYLDIAEEKGFDNMPRNTVVCLRANGTDGAYSYDGAPELYKNCADFFKGLLSHKKEGLVRETVHMALIGDRDLYDNAVNYMEESLYYIARQNDPNTVPVLEYESMQLKYRDGQHIFTDAEKKAAEDMAKGGKILLLDSDVYTYLAEKGLLLDVSSVAAGLGNEAEQYGVLLYKLDIHEANGFYYADDWTEKTGRRIYLCASADAGSYTVELLKYMYDFKS